MQSDPFEPIKSLPRAGSQSLFGHIDSTDIPPPPLPTPFGRRFVVHKNSVPRQIWSALVSCLLLWTGTVFPYLLCFVQMRPGQTPESRASLTFETFVDVIFIIDLFVYFFFTYDDKWGREIDNLNQIAKNYLFTLFPVNLIACLPEPVYGTIFGLVFGDISRGSIEANKLTRLARLQRFFRLGKLVRLGRLAQIRIKISNGALFRRLLQMMRSRIVRIISNSIFLFWMMHLLACGWYVCAVLHDETQDTWIYRRVDTAGIPLAQKGPGETWWHSIYFILTVFTTVGFGDISPLTVGEIAYVSFTMFIGVIANGIIVSEVMNIVMSFDKHASEREKQRVILEAFAEHAELDQDSKGRFLEWSYGLRAVDRDCEKEQLWKVFTSTRIPDTLLRELPHRLFQERLLTNKFIANCAMTNVTLPAQFPLLVACSVTQRVFVREEMVYQTQDQPCDLFLVLHGIFANVGLPTKTGGLNPTGSDVLSRLSPASTLLKFHSELSATVSDPSAAALSPYQLFGPRSFFGDVELLIPGPRLTSVRSEADSNNVLVLSKADLEKLCNEYPACHKAWTISAHRRRKRSWALLEKHTRKRNYSIMAVVRIQRFIRACQKKKKPSCSLTEPLFPSRFGELSHPSLPATVEIDSPTTSPLRRASDSDQCLEAGVVEPLQKIERSPSVVEPEEVTSPCHTRDSGHGLEACGAKPSQRAETYRLSLPAAVMCASEREGTYFNAHSSCCSNCLQTMEILREMRAELNGLQSAVQKGFEGLQTRSDLQ